MDIRDELNGGKHEAHRQVNDLSATARLQAELIYLLRRQASQEELLRLAETVDLELTEGDEGRWLKDSIKDFVAQRQQQAAQQARERGLAALLDTAKDLTALRELETVLQAIVRRARQLLSSDIGYLTNYDASQDEFYLRATDGTISDAFKRVRVARGVGICGAIVRSKSPFHSSAYLGDPSFEHAPGIDQAIINEGVQSLLGVPLIASEKVIGVLCICDRRQRNFAPWEISMLSALASQAAIAIENARLFQEAAAALGNMQNLNLLLHEQAREIEHAAEVHERMTRAVAKGCTIEEIVRMLGELLGGHIWLLDEGEEMLYQYRAPHAASVLGGPSGQREKIQDAVHCALHTSRSSGRCEIVQPGEENKIHVAAINGADRLLGGLVLETSDVPSAMQQRILERGALVAGVVMLSHKRSELAAYMEASALIRGLVSPHQESQGWLRAKFEASQVDVSLPLRLTVVEVERAEREYFLNRVKKGVPSRGVVVAEYDGVIVCVCNETQLYAVHRVQERVLKSGRKNVLGVISGPIENVAAAPRRYDRLRRCINLMHTLRPCNEIVFEESLALYALLFDQQKTDDIDRFVEDTIGALVAHDAKRKSELCLTLLTYLDCGQNARETADALAIHANTMRLRLDSIQQLLGNWQSTGRALELHMSLRLHALRGHVAPRKEPSSG